MQAGNSIPESSVVRQIWGSTDVVLFIFAGASAEFAANKQVDWLYFTGKLPADPIGRLFSTVQYAQQIIFQENNHSLAAIDRISSIHKAVESSRGRSIPASAYLDVLYMLIYYSIASFEWLQRKLSADEKDEVVTTFCQVGDRMGLEDIPRSYEQWKHAYHAQLTHSIANSHFTRDLFRQYRKHLGRFRYFLLLEVQRLLVPPEVNSLLGLGAPRVARLALPAYRLVRLLGLHTILVSLMVPARFKGQAKKLDQFNSRKPASIRGGQVT